MTRADAEKLFNGNPGRRKPTEAEVADAINERARAQRIVENDDVMEFLEELFLDYGGLNYGTTVTDEFTQGRISMLDTIRFRLCIADDGPSRFAQIDRKFYNRLHEIKTAPIMEHLKNKKETKK